MKRSRLAKPRSRRFGLGCEQLEVRRVLDASALPIWDQMPEVTGQSLTVDGGATLTATAESDWVTTFDYDPYWEVYVMNITGYRGSGGAVAIPAQVNGFAVRAVRSGAFLANTNITSITIPAYVSLAPNTLSGCTSLTTVSIQSGFWSIEDSLFANCPNLLSITVPESVAYIHPRAFLNCVNLTDIAVSSTNTAFASIDGVLYDKSLRNLIVMPPGKVGSTTIPMSVTSVGSFAYSSCTKLKSLRFDAGLVDIASDAFQSCTSLATVTIPRTVRNLGALPFSGCTSLEAIDIHPANASYASVDGILYDKWLKTILRVPAAKSGEIAVPASTVVIGDWAFSNCNGLTSVTIPVGVTSIGKLAFSNCTGLTRVVISEGVTIIGDSAFTNCTSLTSVMIPSTVTSISSSAFSNCTGLTRVVISVGVTSIGDSAFSYCTSLTCVTIPSSVATIRSTSFLNCPNLEALYFYGSPPALTGWQAPWSTGTSFRLSTANGWPYSYPIFEPVDVPAGQSTTAAISPTVSRIIKQGEGTFILDTPSNRTGGLVVDGGDVVVRNKNSLGVGLLEVRPGASVHFDIGTETIQTTYLQLSNSGEVAVGAGRLFVWVNTLREDEVRSKLIAGRNGGSWDGASGITSTAAGASSSRAVGYRMDGETLEIAYAAPGDSNLDGVIDILDIGDILAAGKFNTGEPANWQQGDVNYDNVFDIVDLADILGTNLFNEGSYLTQASATSAAVETGTVATFDPALVYAALAAESSSQPTTKRKTV